MIDCRGYWKQVVEDYLECAFGENALTDKQIEWVVEDLLNNDHLWTEIDSYVEESINYIRRKETNDYE